jgi:hypothetical protein
MEKPRSSTTENTGSSIMENTGSSIMENVSPESSKKPQQLILQKNDIVNLGDGSYNYYTYILGFFISAILIYLLWTSYSCFYANQDLINEPFLTGTVKTGTDVDIDFSVEGEINKLREMQERYLNKIRSENN